MAIKFDQSSCTVLAICDQCDWWELELDAARARTRALEHTWSVHPTDAATVSAIGMWRMRRRHAAGGGN